MTYLWNALLYALAIIAIGILPWIVIAVLFQLVANAMRRSLAGIFGINGYIYLTAPGVAVHELSHAFFCLVFRHKITELKLFSPEQDGTLGYVRHSYDQESFYQRAGLFFIGTGPIWGGIFTLFIFSKLLLPAGMLPWGESIADNIFSFLGALFSVKPWTSWTFYLWLYIALTIGSHVTLSKPDLAGAQDGFLMICGVVLLCCIGLGWCGSWEETVIAWMRGFIRGQLPILVTILGLLLILTLIFRPFKRG